MACMVKAAVSIILLKAQGLWFSWSPHLVATLNSMAFLLLLFFVLACFMNANLSRPMCASDYVYGEGKGNK